MLYSNELKKLSQKISTMKLGKNLLFMRCFRFLILLLFILICVYNIAFAESSSFEYNFNKDKISITQSFLLKTQITTESLQPKIIDFNRKSIEKSPFKIIKINYNTEQIHNAEKTPKTIYIVDFEIGVEISKLSNLGTINFPPFEIKLIPTNESEKIEIYKTAPQNITITKSDGNIALVIVLIVGVFITIFVAIILLLNLRKKNKKADEKEIGKNIYRRYVKKREDFIQNKDYISFLNSMEQLAISYILRESNHTNIDDLYKDVYISPEIKAAIKNLLKEIDKYKLIDLKWNSDEFDKLEEKFKSLLFIM